MLKQAKTWLQNVIKKQFFFFVALFLLKERLLKVDFGFLNTIIDLNEVCKHFYIYLETLMKSHSQK